MADRYWVGTALAWSNTAGWSATDGGASGASIPASGDDAHFTALSPGDCTMDVSPGCRSVDFNGYTHALTHNNLQASLSNTTNNASNISLRLVSTMTYTLVSTIGSSWAFDSISGVTQTITSGGKSVANININNNIGNSTFQLADSMQSASGSSGVNLNRGTLDTNGFAHTWGTFTSSNANVRTLTLGASSITISGASSAAWSIATTTNLTITATTATITFTGSGAGWTSGNVGAPGWSLVFNNPAQANLTSGGTTFANLTRTATAAKTDAIQFHDNVTISGTLTLSGNSITNRIHAFTLIPGTPVTITVNGSFSISNADFMDITAAGTAGTWTGTSLGDALGNSNISFPVSRTLYGVGTTGVINWDATTSWSLSSGGVTGQNPPLPQDDVILDGNSGGSGANFNPNSMPRLGRNISTWGFGGIFSIANGNTTIYGNVTLGAGSSTNGTSNVTLAGRGAQTITSNGVAWSSGPAIQAPGGSYTLRDDLLMTNAPGVYRNLTVSYGAFDSASHNITGGAISSVVNATRSITLGTSTVTLYGTGGGNPISVGAAGTLTLSAANATFNFAGSGSGVIQFSFGADTYTFKEINVLNPGSGQIQITNSITVGSLSIAPGRQVAVTAGKTITVTNSNGWQVSGQNWNAAGYQYVNPSSGSTVQSPNAAPVQITGDITIEARIQPVTWNVGGFTGILTKWGSGQQSYELGLTVGGKIAFLYNGTAGATGQAEADSSVAVPFSDGVPGWIRASFQVNSASTHIATFYTSSDGVMWTQLGNPVSVGGAITIFNSTAPIEIGSVAGGTSAIFGGRFYRGRIYNSALGSGAGTPVFDADFSTKVWGTNSFTESSTNAATVTITGVALQTGDGRIQWNSTTGGTAWNVSVASGNVQSDYISLQDSHAIGGASFYAGSHSTLVSGDTGWTTTDAPIPTSIAPAGVFDPALNPTAWF